MRFRELPMQVRYVAGGSGKDAGGCGGQWRHPQLSGSPLQTIGSPQLRCPFGPAASSWLMSCDTETVEFGDAFQV